MLEEVVRRVLGIPTDSVRTHTFKRNGMKLILSENNSTIIRSLVTDSGVNASATLEDAEGIKEQLQGWE